MIVILSQDPDAVRSIASNQANTQQAVFGPARQASMSLPPLASGENLFLVAPSARRGADWAPVLCDEKATNSWTAAQAMQILDSAIPANFTGNVFIAACAVADPTSSANFASAFKTTLAAARRTAGKVYGQASAARGPIPPPGDSRWIEAQAA